MAKVNHKRVKQLLNEKRSKITDRQFFTSRILAGHFEDVAAAQTKRYRYNRRVHVNIYWAPKDRNGACTNNTAIKINAGHPSVTKIRGRMNRYEMMRSIMIRELRGLLNSFSREVFSMIGDLMHPYGSESEDCYEFIDHKGDVQSGYENRSCNCVRLPDGRVVSMYDPIVWGKFEIKDGKVYQKKSGKLKQPKRTHKAKKMQAIPDYPFKKLHKTMHEYAIDYCNYEYDEASQGYGYYCNPNAMWDWYQIGGRWPVTFLVKDTCTEYSFGERSWGNDDWEYPCPEGFMWVSSARKKDIEWDTMKQWYIEQAKKRFTALESMFVAGIMEPEKYMEVKDGCVYHFLDLIYKIGETEEEYLNLVGVTDDRKYPVSFCDLINEDDWITQGNEYFSPEHEDEPAVTWDDTIQQFIDDLDDDDVLVSVDYHM